MHEIRYEGPTLGAAGATLGFVYTGMVRGAALEDKLLTSGVIPAGTVHCQAATASPILGGSGMIAWRRSGTVANVGYSGGPFGMQRSRP